MSESSEPELLAQERRHRVFLDWRTAVSLASAVVAVVALCLAGWSLLRSGDDETDAGSFSDAQRAEAKAKTCGAIELVRRGVSRNTNLVVPGGPADIAGNLASAANARLALYDGGQYLIDRLEPATPSDIADAARGFADTLMDIAAAATAGSLDSDPNQVARRKSADEANTKLGELCK